MPRPTCFRWVAGLFAALCSFLRSAWPRRARIQPASPAFELASLREDVRLLTQRVGDLSLRVEQLERENGDLQAKSSQTYVTLAQLNAAIAELNKAMQAALVRAKRETLQQVGVQLEKLAQETQAAIDALAKGAATRAPGDHPDLQRQLPEGGRQLHRADGATRFRASRTRPAPGCRTSSTPTRSPTPRACRSARRLFIPQGK